MSFTLVDGDSVKPAGSSTTIVPPGVTVNVGDLVVVLAKFEGATTTASCSDGTNSLTQWGLGVTGAPSGEPWLDVFYTLASGVSGTNSIVYTVTLGASRDFRTCVVYVFTPSSACSLDGTAVVGSADSGTSLSSGNQTTTGTDGVSFGCYASYGASLDASAKVNGVNNTAILRPGANDSALYYVPYSAGFTGAATAGNSSSNRWNLGLISFKIGGGGGETITMDKWFSPSKDPIRRLRGVVPSGTTGIKSS